VSTLLLPCGSGKGIVKMRCI